MNYWDISDISVYNNVLHNLINECDYVMFHFPILDEKKYKSNELSVDYENYIQKKQVFLKELFEHGAIQKRSMFYQGIKLGYETQIIKVKLYPELVKKFQNNHFFDWLWWNALPEDPCFFKGECCRFVTISHEEIFYEIT
ncbi:MAG: hypothetical protein E7542_03360 [Ruminococcaceae bacterium]|nr:hypothetical protein [Oscillospiraceae bacterium]